MYNKYEKNFSENMKIKNCFKIYIYIGYTGQSICCSNRFFFFVRSSDFGGSVYKKIYNNKYSIYYIIYFLRVTLILCTDGYPFRQDNLSNTVLTVL